MAFFNQMQNFFIVFILFGLWTTWQNSKYKRFLQLSSIFSIAQIVLNVSLAIILDRLYGVDSLSIVMACFWFSLSIFTHLVIVLE